MEQLTPRDWMVLIGAGLILAVLVDAIRRAVRQRRSEVRLNAKIDLRSAGSTAASDKAFDLLSELPNGGARIVARDDLQPNAALPDSGEIPDPMVPDVDAGDARNGALDSRDQTEEFAPRGTYPAPLAAKAEEYVDEPAEAPAGEEPEVEETVDTTPETLDWLDDLQVETAEREEAKLPRGLESHVFVLNVVSDTEVGFSGRDILQILLACDLRFGDMDFFHRHEESAGRGAIQFSVANMMNPGVFDIDDMDALQTKGLMFFVTLPGPEDMLKAFDYMYETAKAVSKNLGGTVLDETRSAVTRQSLEHMRQQIREFERRLHLSGAR